MVRIAIVDDEESMRSLLEIVLSELADEIRTTPDGAEVLEWVARGEIDIVIQDLRMPKMDGLTLLERIKALRPQLPVVIITAYSTWTNAVEAMRLGAYDYIEKPFDNDIIRQTIARAVSHAESQRLAGAVESLSPEIIGNAPELLRVFELIKRIAPTDSTVCIRGESGTGKELIATAIHMNSTRSDRPMVSVNCGAFTETLLESELFGHVKGSFTGAIHDKKGLFELAHRSTLFLDEVGEMQPTTQVKLLRVLESRRFYPVGGTKPIQVDVRFIVATNRDLEELIAQRQFREDLYYRLNVIPINLPPLRERAEDIPLLAGHFLRKHTHRMGSTARRFSPEAIQSLLRHPWPGNIRELENTIQRAVALSSGDIIGSLDLSEGPLRHSNQNLPELCPGFDLEGTLAAIERDYLHKALTRSEGNLTRAAEILGISFRSIRYKMKKYELR